jgi:hypothetical protein
MATLQTAGAVRRIQVLFVVLALMACAIPFRQKIRASVVSVIQCLKGKRSVSDRLLEFQEGVHDRLSARFSEIGMLYPPSKMIFVGFKQERILEVWVSSETNRFMHLKTYPILAASGTLGPKLNEGDGQVPEGIYKVESLNPNSLYHLALRLNYPNDWDREKGKLDGRLNLGGDIMIHGKSASIGCLAMGDMAAEDLFVLAAKVGVTNIEVILSPVDLRVRHLPASLPPTPNWTPELYREIRKALAQLQN